MQREWVKGGDVIEGLFYCFLSHIPLAYMCKYLLTNPNLPGSSVIDPKTLTNLVIGFPQATVLQATLDPCA